VVLIHQEDILVRSKIRIKRIFIQLLKRKYLCYADFHYEDICNFIGTVTPRQLLATWVVHDLNHIYQIVRVMANQYGDEVGPWIEYLSILKSKKYASGPVKK